MGMMTTAVVGLAGLQVASGIMSGMAQERESKFNASILHQQAGMIEEKKKLQAMQDDRMIRSLMGKSVAATASKGIEMAGSPMAIMIDTRTQLEMDKAIGQYNLDMQRFGVMAEAETEQRRGRLAKMYGVTSGIMSGTETLFGYFGPMAASSKPSLIKPTGKVGYGGKGGYGSGASAYRTLGVR